MVNILIQPPNLGTLCLKDFENFSLEECYFKFLGKRHSLATKRTYWGYMRVFFQHYVQQEPSFEPQDVFRTMRMPYGTAVILEADIVKSFVLLCPPREALDVSKALKTFLRMYKNFALTIQQELDNRVLERTIANAEWADVVVDLYKANARFEDGYQTLAQRKKEANRPQLQPETIRSYCLKFIQSAYVSSVCERIGTDCKTALANHEFSPQRIRDILMGLLELTGGGVRGIIIRSLTLKDFQQRKTVSDIPLQVTMSSGQKDFRIESESVLACMEEYVVHARPLIGDFEVLMNPESPLFPTKNNGFLSSTRNGIEWIKGVMIRENGIESNDDLLLLSLNASSIRKAFLLSHDDSCYRKQITAGPRSSITNPTEMDQQDDPPQ